MFFTTGKPLKNKHNVRIKSFDFGLVQLCIQRWVVNSARLFFGDWDRFSASFNKRQERQKRKQWETEMAATAEH